MDRKEELKDLIKAKQKELDNFEIDPDEYEDEYCEALDAEGDVYVGGLTFSPSQIIRELDPTAYRCGLIDFVDGMDIEEVPEYKELQEELEELEAELEELEAELEDLEAIKMGNVF